MKKIILVLILAFTFLGQWALAQTFPVTFTVIDDLHQHEVIYLKGDFTGWLPELMREDTPGIWSLVLPVGLGNHEWGCENQDGLWLVEGPNLAFTISGFGNVSGQTSYTIPPPIPTFNTMFTLIDPGNGEVGVKLRGEFTDWTDVDMMDVGEGRWEIRVPVQMGSWEWGVSNEIGEWLLDKYLLGANRVIHIAEDGTITGDDEILLPLLRDIDLMFTVNMTTAIQAGTFNPASDIVQVVGTFNNWGETAEPMLTTSDPAILTYEKSILALFGQTIEYKYRIGNSWGNNEFPDTPNRNHVIVDGPNEMMDYYNVRLLSQVPFNENFTAEDFPPPGWVAFDGDTDGYGWKSEEYSGNRIAVSESSVYVDEAWLALTPDNYLYTSAVDLRNSSGRTIHLTYDVASGATGNSFAEKYSVIISAQGASLQYIPTVLYTHTLTEAYKNWNFITQVIDLSDYVGKIVFIGWRHHDCTDQYKLAVDHVKITDVTGLVPADDITGIKVYPIPASRKLFVHHAGNLQCIGLYGLPGNKLMQVENPVGEIEINVTSLNPGVYVLRFIDLSGNILTRKIVIQ